MCKPIWIAGQIKAACMNSNRIPVKYAKITICDPFQAAFDRIPKGYQRILEYLGVNGFKENHSTEFLGCFEEVYEKAGTTYMDVYIHADRVNRGNLHTDFSRDM